MKKMSWGSWIVVAIVLFVAATFVMVYISMNQRVDLVTDDYYEKELQFQQHIDIVKNTNALEGKVSFDFSSSMMNITFPKAGDPKQYSGMIVVFRPSDKSMDIVRDVSVDSAYSQHISTADLMKGMWRVKISWSVGGQNYYTEQPVIIQ